MFSTIHITPEVGPSHDARLHRGTQQWQGEQTASVGAASAGRAWRQQLFACLGNQLAPCCCLSLQDGFSYASFELCGYSPDSVNAGGARPCAVPACLDTRLYFLETRSADQS